MASDKNKGTKQNENNLGGSSIKSPQPVREDDSKPPLNTNGSTPPPVKTDGSTPPPVKTDGSTPPPVKTDDSTPPPVKTDGSTPPPVKTDDSTPPPVKTDDSTPPPVKTDGSTLPPIPVNTQISVADLTTLITNSGLKISPADVENLVRLVNEIGLVNLIKIAHSIPPVVDSELPNGMPLRPDFSDKTSTHDDYIYGDARNDSLNGNKGDDTIDGDAGNDKISGGENNDLLFGGAGNDTIKGDNGDDSIDGGSGNDSLDGGSGDDLIFGGSGNDQLIGGTNNDTLDGGSGKDILTGGIGKDVFVFSNGDSGVATVDRDTIRDFKSGQDKIDLSHFTNPTFQANVVSSTKAEIIATDASLSVITKIDVSAAGDYDAKSADFNFQIAAGDYTYNIANFAKGDAITFPVGQDPTVKNNDSADGIVDLQYAAGGKITTVHLSGFTAEQDTLIYSVDSFNKVFGANSLTPAPVVTNPLPPTGTTDTNPPPSIVETPPTLAPVVADSAVLDFVDKTAVKDGEALGKVWFDKGVIYVSTNNDAAAEFAVELSGVKTLTADDFIF